MTEQEIKPRKFEFVKKPEEPAYTGPNVDLSAQKKALFKRNRKVCK